jgi:hypothetical protein
MEVFDNKICLTGAEVQAVVPSNTFKCWLRRGKIVNIRGKRACFEVPALYPVDSIPANYRAALYERYPEIRDEATRCEFVEQCGVLYNAIQPDGAAYSFFTSHEKLTPERQKEYYHNALVLNACRRIWEQSYAMHCKSGHKNHMVTKGHFWREVAAALPHLNGREDKENPKQRYCCTLPLSERRLKEKYNEYFKGSKPDYATLVTGTLGNSNRTKKQRKLIEQIVLSIYGSKEKLFMNEVCGIYNEFVLGTRDIFNKETGEVYNRSDFYHDGAPITISEGTVFNIINDPLNRKVVDRMRNDFHYNQNHHNAAVEREAPRYALSKISIDDRDLVRKCIVTGKDGKKTTAWVHAYYAFDVASGVCLGAAYSLKKDTDLVYACLRNMWANLRRWGLKTPAECETENHLIKGTEIEDKLYQTFMYVTFCAPMNSREKRAEHKIKEKKWYGEHSERRLGMSKGRFYAKKEAFLSSREKVFDEMNDTYKEPLEPWDFERVVAEDRAQTEAHNNAPHTLVDKKAGKKVFDGMTRMEVLMFRQHTNLAPLSWRHLCYLWGEQRETSIKKGRSCTIDYREWWLTDPERITRLKPNNTTVTAYYIPEVDGAISEIFCYQGERYIDSPQPLGKFQEAKIERTEEDDAVMHRQLGFVAAHKKLAKETKAAKLVGALGSMKAAAIDSILAQPVEACTDAPAPVPVLAVLEPEYAEIGIDFEDLDAYAQSSVASL